MLYTYMVKSDFTVIVKAEGLLTKGLYKNESTSGSFLKVEFLYLYNLVFARNRNQAYSIEMGFPKTVNFFRAILQFTFDQNNKHIRNITAGMMYTFSNKDLCLNTGKACANLIRYSSDYFDI